MKAHINADTLTMTFSLITILINMIGVKKISKYKV